MDFDPLNFKLESLFAIAPTQVANLLLTSYVSTNKPQIILQSKCTKNSIIKKSRDDVTLFPQINCTINHDWIDDTIVLSSTRKADNAPVPASLWDKRIIASFPEKHIDIEILSLFRLAALSFYRKSIRKSFILHLRQHFPNEWISYLAGKRYAKEGEKSEFEKTLEAGVDVLQRADDAT